MLSGILGADGAPEHFTLLQVCARAVVVFVFAVAMARLSSRRFLSDASPFDVIMGIMLGSTLSRTINGPSPLLPTMGAAVMLVVLHRLIGRVTFRTRWLATLFKGQAVVLVDRGNEVEEALRRHHISEQDLLQALRTEGGVLGVKDTIRVTLERSGRISVVTRPHP